MPCSDKMKIEDIIFWIIMSLIVGVAIWKMIGSPIDTAALIAVTLFIAGSEILIWKALFNMDKKTALGFEKIRRNIDNKFLEVNNKLNNVQSLIRK